MDASVYQGAILLTGICTLIALMLLAARQRLPKGDDRLVELVNRTLPQTQCAQCGYAGCEPYARAITKGEAINRCPPGGDATIQALSELLGRPAMPLDPGVGAPGDTSQQRSAAPRRLLARVREAECIGCTLCMDACPVDAIIGAPQLMHTVIDELCTGCDLCREPCPVDCIDMLAHPQQDPQVAPPPSDGKTCIHCGLCEPQCPKALKPQMLFLHRDDPQAVRALNLDECIECRRCDVVCPAALPLTETFRASKAQVRLEDLRTQRADVALHRFEAHEARREAERQQLRTRPTDSEKTRLLETALEHATDSGSEHDNAN